MTKHILYTTCALTLSLTACQNSPSHTTPTTQNATQNLTPNAANTATTTSAPLKHYPTLVKADATGSVSITDQTLTLTLKLPPLPQLSTANDTDFITQKLDLSTASKLFAQVSDSHGKTYAPVGADGNGAVNYAAGTITLTFNNVVPDELLFVEVQAKNGTTNIPQADLATVLKHTTSASPVNTTLNFQTTVAAKAMKALLTADATRARSINLSNLNTLTSAITGVTGTAPNLTYAQKHPSLVNTALLATALQTQLPNALTASDYRQNVGGTVNLTLSGLTGGDKVQLQITDAASAIQTDLGNGSTNLTGLTPGSGLTAIVTPFGTPSQTYTYTINPTSLSLTEGNTTNLTVTATPTMTLTNINPANGPAGTMVTLTGTGFTGATDVRFNGAPAASFTVVNDTQIAATVPVTATDGTISVTKGGTTKYSTDFDVYRRIYVNDDASGNNTGSTWANAYNSLQTALGAAGPQDEIWVAEGTYTPHASDRDTSFQLKENVNIYGGFAGTESSPGERTPSLTDFVTLLSGDLTGNDNYATPGTTLDENTKTIVKGFNNTLLDGVTIQGANGATNGGGMYSYASSFTLNNVTFTHNSATFGGGMNNSSSSPTLINVTFTHNSASSSGGGMANTSPPNESPSSPTLHNVTLANNSAISGGGIYNSSAGAPTLHNVTFANNSATLLGGGMDNFSSGAPTLHNVTFANNSATFGGGIYNISSSLTLKNVLFWNSSLINQAINSSDGNFAFTGTAGDGSDPFVDVTNPNGADGIPRTADDGLRIKATATSITNLGVPITGTPDPEFDILGLARVGRPEPGAYEFIPPPAPPANVILVDKDATGANNGSSWADAYTDLQTALANAPANDEIWIAEGTYTPAAAGNTNTSFQMQANVDMYGGFAGSETSKAQRIAGANTVYLSGDIDNNDTGSGSTYTRSGTNSKTIVIGANATLDGVTIQGASNTTGDGGGMIIANASPTLSNVTFLRNQAISGGGVSVLGSAAPTFNNLVFLLNGANAGAGGGGGAIYNEATFTLNKGYFNGNRATFRGGAVNNRPNTSANLKDALFMNNLGEVGTANDIYNFESTNVTISNTATWNSNSEASIYSLGVMQLNNLTANRTVYCSTNGDCTPKNVLTFNAGASNATNGIDGNYQITAAVGSIDDPFLNANSPLGNDGIPFTTDDGYRLKAGAAVINQGILGETIPNADILGLSRDNAEPGAYEYTP